MYLHGNLGATSVLTNLSQVQCRNDQSSILLWRSAGVILPVSSTSAATSSSISHGGLDSLTAAVLWGCLEVWVLEGISLFPWDASWIKELVPWLRKGLSKAFLMFFTLTCPKPGRFCNWSDVALEIFAKLYSHFEMMLNRKPWLSEMTDFKAYPEWSSQRFHVCFVDLAYGSQWCAQDGMVVFFNAFLDEIGWFELKLLEGRQIMANLFRSR